MDPNATLTRIRELSHLLQAGRAVEGEGVELAYLVTALDAWLSGGGFPPTDWER